jgi:glycosyltransferase involved in cell wall biosynthesis
MPTNGRHLFVPRAIEYFLRQDYPSRELVILDDGGQPVEHLLPGDSRIRYIRATDRGTIGGRRNQCIANSHGDLIAHWDDDDWQAPDRLSRQIAALLHVGAAVCGVQRVLYYDLTTGRAWHYRYPADRPFWLASTTLLYRREFWQHQPFLDQRAASTTAFLQGRASEQAFMLDDETLHVGMIHPSNSIQKHLGGERWRPLQAASVQTLIDTDWPFYARLQQRWTRRFLV